VAARIVSLLPAATELVAALGAAESLVGTSHECDWPPELRDRPRLTRSSLTARGSAAIDAEVRGRALGGLTLFDLDVARLRELAPDIVITQDLCDVCAVALDDVRAALRELAGRKVELVALSPMGLDDLFGDLARVGAALGREREAARLAVQWRERLDSVRRRAASAWSRPRVVTVEWLDPVMLGGTWMPELVEIAGGVAVGAVARVKAPSPTREELEALDADVVVLKPCGYSLAQALAEADIARRTLPLERWPAGALGHVYVADGSSYFNRPGPRLIDSAELLAACVQPDLFRDFAQQYSAAFRPLTPSRPAPPLPPVASGTRP